MSILLLPKTVASKHSGCASVQYNGPAPVPSRALHLSCKATEVPSIAARSSNEKSITGKRQPRRHERDAVRQQARIAERSSNNSPSWAQQPDNLDATDDHAVLAAISSCRNVQELNILYTFLLDQQKQKANGLILHSSPSPPFDQQNHFKFLPPPQALPQALTPPDPSPYQPLTHSPQQRSAQEQQRLPPQQAVHLLARLSQLSPSPALAASPPLDTTLAYDPLPQASGESQRSSSSSSAPAGYVQPQAQLQQLQHQQQGQQQQQQQQQSRSGQAHRGVSVQTAAHKDRATEIVEEELAEDEESVRAMQKRNQQQQLVEGLLSSAMCGLPQLPLSSITGLLSALARLGYRCRGKSQNPVAQIAAHLLHRNALLLMYRRDPRALAHTAWALAKLEHDPGPHWISQFLLASSASLPKLTAVDLSATAWSLARWRFRPTPQWLDAYYARLRQVAPQLKTQGICNVCWALTMLRVPPPRDVAELLMVEAQVQLPFFSGTALATLCWSLAALGHKPPMFWLHEVFDSLTRALPKVPLASRGVPHANVAWALSVWQVSPPSDFLAHLCATATPHLPRMSATSCAVLLTGLADLGHRPKQAWVSLALEEFHKRHSDATPSSLVAVVWAVSRLMQPAGTDSGPPVDWAPPRKWRVRYAHILQDIAWAQSRAFSALEPAQLVDAAVAFADLSFYPGDEWMDRHEAYCNMRVEAFTAYQVRLLSSCMEKLDSIFEGDYLPRDGEVV